MDYKNIFLLLCVAISFELVNCGKYRKCRSCVRRKSNRWKFLWAVKNQFSGNFSDPLIIALYKDITARVDETIRLNWWIKSWILSAATDLPRCNSGDNECLPKVITQVLKMTKNGNAQMNLPPFDPLHIPQVNIIQDEASTIAIKLYFKDANLYGIPDAVINKTV